MISKMATPQPSSTTKQSGQADLLSSATAMSINFGPQQLPLASMKFSQAMIQASNPASLGTFPFAVPNKQSIGMTLSSKRDQLPVSVQSGMEPLPRVQNEASASIGTPFPFTFTSGKQQAHKESLQKLQTTSTMAVTGSNRLPSINKRPAQTELPAKVQGEDESVRSKLRESLASTLDTGSKEPSKSKSLEKRCIGEEEGLLRQAEAPHQNEIHPSAVDGSPREASNYLASDKQDKKFDGNLGLLGDAGSGTSTGDRKEDDIICNVQDGQQKHDIVLDEIPFSHSVMEDELLQGHGLSWASDFTSVNEDSVLHSLPKRPKFVPVEENRDVKDTILQTSANLAAQIEAELFKFFGGVNKKYKEKGRSLLFNLKDPSNPELRERVLSGDVSPRRLCSMTAEELASKELSQWRQAKAEEFAQMVMLPDMNVDIRRLVRKTHKGEFQVEVEQDDGAHPEVGLGLDVISVPLAKDNEVDQDRPRSNFIGPTSSRNHDSEVSHEVVHGDKSDSDERNVSSSSDPRFTEKTDYIQDLIVEEMKDAELLPPVVSLDEFMQALDSEPPFENLEVDNLQENSSPADRNLDRPEPESIHVSEPDGLGHKVGVTPDISPSKLASVNILGSQSHNDDFHTKPTKGIFSNSQVAYNYQKGDDKLKIETDYEKQVLGIADSAPNCSNIWEGFLQLNVSSLANVISFFLSGEKTSMQGWPNFLEVKGRVRLDAFEKFLQELPLSRSRAIMIVEFRWKEDSPESGQLYLSEAIHSYIADERVGFAEPAPGVELYLCPPHSKLTAMLGTHLSNDLLDNVDRVVSGLVGIVVWRRTHAIMSPRVSSHHHHKHGSLKRHSGGSKKHQDGGNRLPPAPHGNPAPPPEDIDDIPPGFGPRISRDVEDLPEFDFSRGDRFVSAAPQQNSAGRALPGPPPPRARELIQRYGQGGSNARELGIPVQPWNEEDDIPEWKPNPNTKQIYGTQSVPPPPQLHVYQQPQHFMMNQPNGQPIMQQPTMMHVQPIMQQPNGLFFGAPPGAPVQIQAGIMLQSATPWWPAAHGMPDGGMPPGGSIRPCHFGGHPSGGLPPGFGGPRMVHGFGGANNGTGSWRPDNTGSRGFF